MQSPTLAETKIVAVVNGYNIRRVERPVGFFYAVEGTGHSFLTQGDACRYAESGIFPAYHPAAKQPSSRTDADAARPDPAS